MTERPRSSDLRERCIEVTSCPDVDALSWLIEEQQATLERQPTADHELLLIATGVASASDVSAQG